MVRRRALQRLPRAIATPELCAQVPASISIVTDHTRGLARKFEDFLVNDKQLSVARTRGARCRVVTHATSMSGCAKDTYEERQLSRLGASSVAALLASS
jgi:hypothetical protein